MIYEPINTESAIGKKVYAIETNGQKEKRRVNQKLGCFSSVIFQSDLKKKIPPGIYAKYVITLMTHKDLSAPNVSIPTMPIKSG